MNIIELNISKIVELCKKYKVHTLCVFGSILTDKFNENSDVDLLVNFDKDITYHTYSDNYFGFLDALKSLFGREVDLVDESAIRNKYFKEELDETKRLIYG
ncbi:MAG: nucleotidyltransferase domain-containing protein [Muribaculaceae bacterium]|nr:nucleotidyltransferase domain-containing protein [Muribaculaceae bacterium]